MNRNNDKTKKAGAEGKTDPRERRKFLRSFFGIGIAACFFRPGPARPGLSAPVPSVRADFWRKGGRLAG